jgi:hypothetical protein
MMPLRKIPGNGSNMHVLAPLPCHPPGKSLKAPRRGSPMGWRRD